MRQIITRGTGDGLLQRLGCLTKAFLPNAQHTEGRLRRGQLRIEGQCLLEVSFRSGQIMSMEQEISQIAFGFSLAKRRRFEVLVEFKSLVKGRNLHPERVALYIFPELLFQRFHVGLKSEFECFLNRRVGGY